MKKIKMIFSEKEDSVSIVVGENNYGDFTIIEKALRQVYQLKKGSSIVMEDALSAVNALLSNLKMKTNHIGSLTLVFLVHRMFPEFSINCGQFPAKNKVFFAYSESDKKHFFYLLQPGGTEDQLSEFLFYEYEAFKFLNFLWKLDVVDESRFKELEIAIRKSTLYSGRRKALLN